MDVLVRAGLAAQNALDLAVAVLRAWPQLRPKPQPETDALLALEGWALSDSALFPSDSRAQSSETQTSQTQTKGLLTILLDLWLLQAARASCRGVPGLDPDPLDDHPARDSVLSSSTYSAAALAVRRVSSLPWAQQLV